MQMQDVWKVFQRTSSEKGLGGFIGVFIPGVVTMLGVVIFLRFGYLLGHLGFSKILLLICFSFSISFLTALSISSISTNMRMQDGGAYFIISRLFGLPLGSSIGFALYLRQTIGICLCALGFSESFVALFPQLPL